MRIFVLGTGATGSYLAHLLTRQGHQVTCGDRDLDRARRFLGKKSTIPVVQVNARNLWGIVRAAKGSQLLVNASASVFNEIVLRAALRLRAHYTDLSAHLMRNPFKAEQLRFDERFQKKNRVAVITTGAAPGLTNLLVARASAMMDSVEAVYIRLYESIESDDPVSQWSAEVSFDEAISLPRIVRNGRFKYGKRFGEPEKFRFLQPIGETTVVLAAQDEVGTVPYFLKLKDMDVKIGGNEIDRLRRWYRQGKLSKSRGLVASRFPKTPSPRQVARMIRQASFRTPGLPPPSLCAARSRIGRWKCASTPHFLRSIKSASAALPSRPFHMPRLTWPRYSSNIFRATRPEFFLRARSRWRTGKRSSRI